MLKLCLFMIILCMSHRFTVNAKNKTKEEVYYKLTGTVDPDTHKSTAREEVKILMEGQPPSLKPLEPRLNDRIVKKGSIMPRKGVLNKLNETVDHNATLLYDHLIEKPVEEKTDEGTAISESKKPINVNISILPSSTTKSSTILHAMPKQMIHQEENMTTIITTKTTKKHNPKPTVTIAEKEADDESMLPFPTNKTPLGMPRKIDYIVPVVITITALPLLGIAFYVLYKRGRDYWDKRHYRRMDFLIDGMYNE